MIDDADNTPTLSEVVVAEYIGTLTASGAVRSSEQGLDADDYRFDRWDFEFTTYSDHTDAGEGQQVLLGTASVFVVSGVNFGLVQQDSTKLGATTTTSLFILARLLFYSTVDDVCVARPLDLSADHDSYGHSDIMLLLPQSSTEVSTLGTEIRLRSDVPSAASIFAIMSYSNLGLLLKLLS